MSRIPSVFENLRQRNECALIPYLTAGFPTPEATLGLLQALERGGADIIELGIPFSDPAADGPTIQRASSAALAAGMTLRKALEIVREFRKTSETPIVLFGAYNPFFHYGIEKITKDASQAGADAMLIADLPGEEAGEVEPFLDAVGMELIHLIAPTTRRERKAEICSRAKGFLYYISVKGVTGARASMALDLSEPLKEIQSLTSTPVAVGFGISTPDQAANVAQHANGTVVGSALIDLIDKNRNEANLNRIVEEFMRSFKSRLVGKASPVASA